MSRPMVVLPQPDSPTRPNVDPTGTAKGTSATAETCPTLRCSTAPAVTVKFFTSRETVSSGASTAPSGTVPSTTGPLATTAPFATGTTPAAAAGDGATSGRCGGSDTNGDDGSCTSALDPTGK